MLRLVLYIVYVGWQAIEKSCLKTYSTVFIYCIDTDGPNTDLVISKFMGVNGIVIVECG